MEEKNKKKKRLKLKLSRVILLLLFLALIYYLYFYIIGDNIKHIYIKGNSVLSDQEIIDIANLQDYPSFLKTTSLGIKRRLKANMFIKNVIVRKKLNYTIYIEVEEYKPLFRRKDNDKIVLGNKKEYLLDKIYDVPLLLNYVPNTIYSSFVEKMDNTDVTILNKISEIKYDPNEFDKNRFLLFMNDGNKVYINTLKFDTLNKYDEIVMTLEGKKGTLYLDSGNYFEIDK